MEHFIKQSILIIGGMGPQASLSIHGRLIKAAVMNGAQHNEDFPAITHLSIPVADFISNPVKKSEALTMIMDRLESLWRSYNLYQCSHSL